MPELAQGSILSATKSGDSAIPILSILSPNGTVSRMAIGDWYNSSLTSLLDVTSAVNSGAGGGLATASWPDRNYTMYLLQNSTKDSTVLLEYRSDVNGELLTGLAVPGSGG